MDISGYLNRVKLDMERITNDLESLSFLQQSHLFNIPFENLDVIYHHEIILELPLLYDKIILNKRGGYCYELNGLFHWLLQELGFASTMVSGKVRNKDNQTFGPEFDHLALLVEVEGTYFIVDVGFGDSSLTPVPLTGKIINDISGTYRILSNYEVERGYLFQKYNLETKLWEIEYIFSAIPRSLSDFNEMNIYQQKSKDSHFTQKILATIATEIGRATISGETLHLKDKDEKRKINLNNTREIEEALYKYFGITLNQ